MSYLFRSTLGCLGVAVALASGSTAQTSGCRRDPRSSAPFGTIDEAHLVGVWEVVLVATRGRYDLNPDSRSFGRASQVLRLARVDTRSNATRVLGVEQDTLRDIGGRVLRALDDRSAIGDTSAASLGRSISLYGRTLYIGQPGILDAAYDALRIERMDTLQMSGSFHRSWGIAVPLNVSGDSAQPPAGYFCARKRAGGNW
jgi:hypothetical protein